MTIFRGGRDANRSVSCDLQCCLPCASIGANYKSCGSCAGTTSKSFGGETTVTGCLKGHTDGFDLIEKDGTMRLLMSPSDKLKPYVYHWVKLGVTATIDAMLAPAVMKALLTNCGFSRSRKCCLTKVRVSASHPLRSHCALRTRAHTGSLVDDEGPTLGWTRLLFYSGGAVSADA